jgi:hypothetical protein
MVSQKLEKDTKHNQERRHGAQWRGRIPERACRTSCGWWARWKARHSCRRASRWMRAAAARRSSPHCSPEVTRTCQRRAGASGDVLQTCVRRRALAHTLGGGSATVGSRREGRRAHRVAERVARWPSIVLCGAGEDLASLPRSCADFTLTFSRYVPIYYVPSAPIRELPSERA